VDIQILAYFVLSYALGLLGIWIMRKKITVWIAQSTWEYIINELKSETNQQAIALNVSKMILEPLKMATIGQLGGLGKGINAQLRQAESELIAGGIDQASGISGIGEIAMGYLKKYPALRAALPILMQQLAKGGPQNQGGLP
jgi:hypothetical protein